MPLEPPEGFPDGERRQFEQGWRDLQQGNLEAASSALGKLGRRFGSRAEVATANGFVDLRLGNTMAAERYFKTALRERPDYGPALGGYFMTALAIGDEERAYARLRALEKEFPQHELVERYAATLRVNVAEKRLSAARSLLQQERYREAAEAYLRVLDVAPEVAGLYLEAAEAELRAGLSERAVIHAEKAVELEPENASSHRLLGEARSAAGDLTGAVVALRKAVSLNPRDAELKKRLDALEEQYRAENVPPEYLEIPDAERLTREQLAALLYIELRDAVRGVTDRTRVIATDIGDSWARDFIRTVVGAGILEVFPNHTFQPRAFVRRIELARALRAALETLSPAAYEAALQSSRFDQGFPDLSPQNVDYEAAALSVSLGLLMPAEAGRFEPLALVSGREAVTAVEALAAHVTP